MLKAFANTLKVPELRKRILFTAGLVAICRLVSLVPTPGVDGSAITSAIAANAGSASGGLLGMVDIFTGGALGRCSVGFFGIWPYISASIILQLMTAIVPALERMARDGEAGRQKLNQWTRYFTIVICVFQSFVLARALEYHPSTIFRVNVGQIVLSPGIGFEFMTVVAMTTAAMFIMWLGDQITARGVGNGISLIIMINICSRLPVAILEAQEKYFPKGVPNQDFFQLVVLLVVGFVVCAATVMLTQGVRRVQIHSARRSAGGGSYGGMANYMPLRVNFSGVMPIIFAGPLLTIPGGLLSNLNISQDSHFYWIREFGIALASGRSALYLVLFSALILFFSFFWVATQFNAVRIADDLKRTGAYVPGIRPGRATAEFLDHTMSRVTFIGAIGLIVIAIFPTLLTIQINLPWEMSSFFGGTSLLIIVGVALDTLRQMESYLTMRHYDGFLKHGRIQSRG